MKTDNFKKIFDKHRKFMLCSKEKFLCNQNYLNYVFIPYEEYIETIYKIQPIMFIYSQFAFNSPNSKEDPLYKKSLEQYKIKMIQNSNYILMKKLENKLPPKIKEKLKKI